MSDLISIESTASTVECRVIHRTLAYGNQTIISCIAVLCDEIELPLLFPSREHANQTSDSDLFWLSTVEQLTVCTLT